MSNNITITFPDGNTKLVEKGISGFELASQISKSLAKESVAIKIDEKICDLSLPLNNDCKVVIIKRENAEALDIIRHDCAHVMAEAVQHYIQVHKLQLVLPLKMVFIMTLHERNLLQLQTYQK